MHVEFLGLPGSGKTTLCATALRALRDERVRGCDAQEARYRALRRAGRDTITRAALRVLPPPLGRRLTPPIYARSTDRWAALTRFTTRHPALLEVVLRSPSVLEGPSGDRTLVVSWMFNLFATYDLALHGLVARDALVLDEGFCSRALTLFASDTPPNENLVIRYLDLMPAPDLVFLVEASPAACAGRLTDRGRPERLRLADDVTLDRRLRSAEVCMGIAAERLPALGSSVVRVPNEAELAPAARLVETHLREWVGNELVGGAADHGGAAGERP